MAVDKMDRTQFEWALYHPHFHRDPDKSNTIYFAKNRLDIPGLDEKTSIGGAGVFSQFSSKLQLTAPESSVSVWKLPLWIFPKNETSALTYHRKLERWDRRDTYTLLQTVGKGQEFVLDCSQYPESMQWMNNLFTG